MLAFACASPPIAPNDANLQNDYVSGTVVPFGDKVTYTCQPDHFFVKDYFKHNFTITCLNTGLWEDVQEWEKCIRPIGNYDLLCQIVFFFVLFGISSIFCMTILFSLGFLNLE